MAGSLIGILQVLILIVSGHYLDSLYIPVYDNKDFKNLHNKFLMRKWAFNVHFLTIRLFLANIGLITLETLRLYIRCEFYTERVCVCVLNKYCTDLKQINVIHSHK